MKIHYSNPFNIEKNIGKAYNEFCEMVPNDNDWIVLQDGDICYLTPDWGRLVYDSLKVNGDQFGLIGCYTNRLRSTHQLYGNKFSNDHEIKNHYLISQEYAKREAKINDIGISGVAGLFMCFKKSTWLKTGGFKENSYVFDTDFNNKVRRLRMRIGLINNLYVYHWYRGWDNVNPAGNVKHLV